MGQGGSGSCSLHGFRNNDRGYCSGCEADPNIVIQLCRRCGLDFALNIDLARVAPAICIPCQLAETSAGARSE